MADDLPATSVLAIDDDTSFLYLLDRQLEQIDGHRFTLQQAGTIEHAMMLLKEDDGIELLLLDYRLSDGNADGLGLLKQLRSDGDHRPVIVMTAYGDEYIAAEVIKNGGDDYLVKSDIDPGRLTQTIERVLDDWQDRRDHARECHEIRQRLESLTRRQREVLNMIVAGLTNREIAAKFFRSEKTIKIHRANVMSKMQAATPADLARLFMTAEPHYTFPHDVEHVDGEP